MGEKQDGTKKDPGLLRDLCGEAYVATWPGAFLRSRPNTAQRPLAYQGEDHHDEEIEVGDALKLLKQVERQEVVPRIPRRDHSVGVPTCAPVIWRPVAGAA